MKKICFWLVLFSLVLPWAPVSALAGLPEGSFHTPVDPDCWPDNAFRALNPGKGSMKKQAGNLQKWVDHCQPRWFQETQNSLFNLVGFMRIKYPSSQPYARTLKIPLADGRKLRGLLAVKPGSTARDLVILRCGLFCDSGEGAVTSMALMNVFEENPVHILILNSSTGPDYARDNGVSHLGGFDEGYQNLEVAKIMVDYQRRFKMNIRRVHILGVSLGGNSSLFSSIFYEATPDFRSLPMGNFVAVCPLVDAHTQFESVFGRTSIASWFFKRELGDLLQKITPFVSPLQSMGAASVASMREQEQLGMALDISADYYWKNWKSLGFAPHMEKPSRLSRADLLEASNINHYPRNTFSPGTFVLHASDDGFVPWVVNSKTLLSRQDDRLGVLRVDRGNHCAFGPGLGWPVFSNLISRALGAWDDMPARKLKLPPTAAAYFSEPLRWSSMVRSHYQWFVDEGKDFARLRVWKYSGRACRHRQTPTFNPGSPYDCQSQSTVKIPLAELEGLGIPASAGGVYRANRIERYLNVHTRFRTKAGKLAVSEEDPPAYLEARGRFHPDYGVY